jgi:NDP-sugar pyrophosphorylase family protein
MNEAMRAVILAGGRGQRLRPYTSVLPKPLMPLGERAIVEVIVDRLVDAGIRDITLCVGYLAHLIEAVLNGRPRDAQLSYVHEDGPLGTAGPLRLVGGLDRTFLVMNGDLLTDLRFEELAELHRRSGNLVTIATHERRHVADYGVLQTVPGESPRVVAYLEKPETSLTVSMGVYVMEPEVLERIPASGHFDFPQLVQQLLDEEQPVGTMPFTGFWLDIGRGDDYELALDHWHRNVPPVEGQSSHVEQPSLPDGLSATAAILAGRDPAVQSTR